MLNMITAIILTAEPQDVEPTALGLNAGGWVAMAMLAVILITVWQKVPSLVAAMLDKRIAEIKDQLESATKLRAEAEALKAEYEAKAKALEADAAAMMEHAQAEAKLLVTKAESDCKDLITRRTQMAQDKIAAAEAAGIAHVRAKAAETTANAAQKLIMDGHGAAQDKKLVTDAIAALN